MADVTSVMTPNPCCCQQDTPLQAVAQMMIDHDCGMIPVVDADGKLAGVAAIADLALAGKDEATAQVVKEISEPGKG